MRKQCSCRNTNGFCVLCDECSVKEYLSRLNLGDKIKFRNEKQRFTVKAKSDRYLICTKPFNLQKTCLYTIIDLDRFERGTNDRVFNDYDYMLQDDIDRCLSDLESCDVEVSYRNCVPLDVVTDVG
jgi:hypothetical protein